ncbi:MAG: SIMPL domain-containing protein, partial [Anaerolineae bacterium]|nr:SIMPL domain-containing protein [Anaerolineae bacterium]
MRALLGRGILAIAVLLTLALPVWAQEQPQPRLITVTGDAEVRVVPDEVILTLGVETWDKNLMVAKRENDDRVKRAIALAKEYKIEAKHIQTDYLSIEPRYRYEYEKWDFIGFFVRKTIVVTLKDISKFEDLLTGLLGAGITHVHGIQFHTTDLRKHRDEARTLAIKAAQEKANALAKDLGQKVGKPRTISEEPSYWWSWYQSGWGPSWGSNVSQNVVQNMSGSASMDDSTIAPGQITVKA